MPLKDHLGQKVTVLERVHRGHHQHGLESIGILREVDGHLVGIDVEVVSDDGAIHELRVSVLTWFNTTASTFACIELGF